MNILITSAGIRGYIINYFKEVLEKKGKVFAADSNKYAPALYNADKGFLIPRADEKNYINSLIKICVENKINGIVSLNDLELPVLSQNKKRFLDNNIEIIVSDPEIIDICFDKYKTYEFLKRNGFSVPKTYISIDNVLEDLEKILKFPLIIKPRKGSASEGIKRVYNKKDLIETFKKSDNQIIQELFTGKEYGIDVFNDENSKPVGIYVKKKIKMRAGETDKAVSVNDKKIIELIEDFSTKIGLYGPADIDLFKQDGGFYITEINPRFGGGYALSHAIGADFPKKVMSLIKGEKIESSLHKSYKELVMMKQYKIMIKNKEELI